MQRRSPALYVVAVGMAVLVVGLVLTVLPGPGLLVAVAGALGVALGLVLLMVEHRADPGPVPPADGHREPGR